MSVWSAAQRVHRVWSFTGDGNNPCPHSMPMAFDMNDGAACVWLLWWLDAMRVDPKRHDAIGLALHRRPVNLKIVHKAAQGFLAPDDIPEPDPPLRIDRRMIADAKIAEKTLSTFDIMMSDD